MMMRSVAAAFGVFALVSPMLSAQPPGRGGPGGPGGPADAEEGARRFIQRHDQDGDGRVSRREMPGRAARVFDRIDRDRNGYIELSEDVAFRRELDSLRGRGGFGGFGGPRRGGGGPRAGGPRDFANPSGGTSTRDLEYARVDDNRGNGKSLRLDVFVPRDAKGRLPLIVWLHGGGWQSGSKERSPAMRYVSQGYVVASVNYRLSHEGTFPAQIHDCKAAIRWLRANAEKFHIDPRRIGVWGASAGGHLAALLGTTGDVRELEGKLGNEGISSRVQAVCDYFGPTDFLQMDAHAHPNARMVHDSPYSSESRLIGGPIQQNRDKVARANPITYVSKDDAPFLIVHGDQDTTVAIHQSQLLFDALKKARVEATFHTVRGAGHGFWGRRDIDRMVDAFFAKHLK